MIRNTHNHMLLTKLFIANRIETNSILVMRLSGPLLRGFRSYGPYGLDKAIGGQLLARRVWMRNYSTPRRGARRSAAREAEIAARNKNFAGWMLAIALGTMGLSYLSVPLYRVFCQVTGFGGTTRGGGGAEEDTAFVTPLKEAQVVEGRPIRIRFNANVSAKVPWKFTPSQSEIVVLPGETALAFYSATNFSDNAITGIATYNVAPARAGIYFNKVQCFCFDEQRLKAGEEIDMPVFFFIDPEFATDDSMADVTDITLSYTFFRAEDVTAEQLQRAQTLAMGGN